MTTDRFLLRFLAAAVLATLAVLCLSLALCSAAPFVDALPDALPDAVAAPPPSNVIEVPVTAEGGRQPIKKALDRIWGLIPCPTCPSGYRYGWIEREVEDEPTLAEAAAELAKGGLSAEREKLLARIIDAPARAKHWSPGTCGMLGCRIHPGQEVYDDEESQEETDAKTVPWESAGRGFRLFRHRSR